MISMSWCGCGGKPDCGAMMSSFHTRRRPQCMRVGSWYWAKEKWCRVSSQPCRAPPNRAWGRRSIMATSVRLAFVDEGHDQSDGAGFKGQNQGCLYQMIRYFASRPGVGGQSGHSPTPFLACNELAQRVEQTGRQQGELQGTLRHISGTGMCARRLGYP